MCPLQIINDIEAMSLTLHGVIHALSTTYPMLEITQSAISHNLVNKKMVFQVTYFYIFLQIFSSRSFLTSGQSAFNAPAVIYSKIQGRLGKEH